MRKTYPYTFNHWMVGQCSDVKTIPKEEYANYESEYVRMYNYIRERGWYKDKNKWKCSKTGSSVTNIKDAYLAQKNRDRRNGEESSS